MPQRILIYEDNDLLRESLSNLLKMAGEFEICGAFGHCEFVEEQVRTYDPDVILMDIDLPRINGIQAVRLIRKFNTRVQILMLTVFDDNNHVFDALCAGANGYLLKKFISDKLVLAIREVMQGGAPMSPAIARMIISNMHSSSVEVPETDYHLTPREKEILVSLSKGNSHKMIAVELHISIETVRTHLKRIYDKLHVRSQVEAVSKAFNEKLV